jgi:hypothetical protein
MDEERLDEWDDRTDPQIAHLQGVNRALKWYVIDGTLVGWEPEFTETIERWRQTRNPKPDGATRT